MGADDIGSAELTRMADHSLPSLSPEKSTIEADSRLVRQCWMELPETLRASAQITDAASMRGHWKLRV